MTSYLFELTWGVFVLVGGGILATNVWGAAERLQSMSYAYRSWPGSATTCRVLGGVFMIVGVGALAAAAF
ncbi:hypothetical protein AB0D12_36865 [Streptomyces sp. NPDC048479]|uniref:hypothetical protein n=1 Tax=Streptomyces sp. NPDC048479 TaxID=3154725 RepID=UPI003440115B